MRDGAAGWAVLAARKIMDTPLRGSSVRTGVFLTSQSRFYQHPWVERILLVALILSFVVWGLIPAWTRLNTDFPNYYLAARLFHQNHPFERVYDWVWFQRQKDHLGIDRSIIGTVPLTPPSLVALAPLSSLSPLRVKQLWLLLNLVFLLATIVLLKLSVRLQWQQVALLVFLAVIPLRNNFRYGQMHVFVLVLLALATYLYFRNRGFLSGIVLALAAALKIYPAIFLIFFLLKKRGSALLGLGVGIAGVLGWCLAAFGVDVCRFYLLHVMPWGLRGETLDPYNAGWNSLAALLRRLFIAEPELNPFPVAHAPWVYAVLYPATQALIFIVFGWVVISATEDTSRHKLEWATFLSLLLLASPQPASYHFVALIIPVVLAVDYLVAHSEFRLTCVLIAIYVLICSPLLRPVWTSPTGWENLLCFPRLVFMLLFCGILVHVLASCSSEPFTSRLRSRDSLWAALAFLLLASVGTISNLRHFKGQFDNYRARVVVTPNSLMAVDPTVNGQAVFFSTFVPEGYAVQKSSGSTVTKFRSGGDWFHPTVGRAAGTAWAEVAAQQDSRVVRFRHDDPAGYEAGMVVEAENAEEPTVSPDGEMLAFIRETSGRGGLWLERITARDPGTKTIEPHLVAGAEYDVRQAAFFPDDRMVFSSRRNGRSRLYIADPNSGNIDVLNATDCSAEYPAVSPDGQWLAFSCERSGTWQVSLMNLYSGRVSGLTDADCNSTSPAWLPDSKTIVYATDCGRGLGLNALARIRVNP
jgi:Glycosyltransferase family 87/WD40-like Beta Propeller Repeat